MNRPLARGLAALLILCVTGSPVWATCGGGGGGGGGGTGASAGGSDTVYHVPWKVSDDAETQTEGLILYWFPASAEEVKMSPLRTSRTLALLAGQCVGMEIASPGSPIGRKLDVKAVPTTVLASAAGNSIGRVDGQDGKLKVDAVERLAGVEVRRRDDAGKKQMSDGKAKAKAGDTAGATEAFKALFDEKCLFPKRAKDAAKELKKLGVSVDTSALLDGPSPSNDAALSARILDAMTRGLEAENAGSYDAAARLYAEARAMDPGDPTPVRYLGELYRHHTGDWARAREAFEALLALPGLDPLSRAVALHGLGKMTIHEGEFQKGLKLLEDSVRAYPIALAYRNLAVYWNSEGDTEQAGRYVDLALSLEPDEPYNLIFAAAFMAGNGRGEEALRIAREHEALLPASYNLAAVYAQLGRKDEALRLLRRHFYEYERYRAVRAKEMMEARVDAVFASLLDDARFVSLTAMADGTLQPMR
jgi:tetratricopeptide (TPR) repeat protein